MLIILIAGFLQDSFELPVEGTETRVNAQAQCYEYMTAYIEAAKQVSQFSYETSQMFAASFLLPF